MALWPEALCFSVQAALMWQLVAVFCCLAVNEWDILYLREGLLIVIFGHMIAALGPLCEAKGLHHPISLQKKLIFAHFVT